MGKSKAKNRPKVKSKKKTVGTLGWGEGNKNVTTLRNIEKATDEEKDLTNK